MEAGGAAWAAGEPEGLTPMFQGDGLDHLPARFFERNFLGHIVLVIASRREVDTLYCEQRLTSSFANCLRLVRLGLLNHSATEELIGRGAVVLDREATAVRSTSSAWKHLEAGEEEVGATGRDDDPRCAARRPLGAR